jgi:hypothetical protein
MGCTAVVPYCLMLLRRCHYRGSGSGLPADDGHWKLPNNKRFKIRVLVPCYKVRLTPSRCKPYELLLTGPYSHSPMIMLLQKNITVTVTVSFRQEAFKGFSFSFDSIQLKSHSMLLLDAVSPVV